MASNPRPVEALEMQADRERERVTRRVAELRQGVERQLDLRRMAEDRIRAKPGAAYGAAAGVALLVGYLLARILKA